MESAPEAAKAHKETHAQPDSRADGPTEAAADVQYQIALSVLRAVAPLESRQAAIRRAALPVSAAGLLQLQRHAGNAQVSAMLAQRLAPRTAGPPPPSPGSPAAVQAQLGEGQPLDGAVRSQMESTYGADFSDVRVHTDSVAAGLSVGLDAQAFTVGKHVAFDSGTYAPGTPMGDTIIAHELAHTIQQDRATAEDATNGNESPQLEADADRAATPAVGSIWSRAAGAVAGIAQRAVPSLTSGLRLQRCTGKTPPPTTAERVEFTGSHPMASFGGDPKVSPVWTPGASDHAVAYTKGANPVVNAVFQVGSLPTDAGVSSVQVRVKEGGAVRGQTTLTGAPTGRVAINGLTLTGLTGSTGVRSSAYSLNWEASADGSTWSPLVSTGTHPIYWLYAAPRTALRNMAVARATTFANGANDAMGTAVALRSGLSGSLAYNPSDPINADPLTVFADGVGICTDFGNLLTLLALSVGLNANAVMFFGGFMSQGRNIWVTKAGSYGTLTHVKGTDASKYTPPGWDFSYHVISRVEGSLQDAALNTAGIDAQAFHDGKILHLVELAPTLSPPAARVGTAFNWQVPRKDHTVAVTVRDYGPQIDISVFNNDVLPIGVPTGAPSPFDVPVHWSLTGGALPAGLTLNPVTGQLSGTPTAAGSPSLGIRTTYGAGLFATGNLTLNVAPRPRRRRATVP